MKHIISALCLFLVSSLMPAYAADIESALIPPPPQINARAYYLMDFDSGRVLAESNANTRMEPASLTKMMTAYIVDAELRDGKLKLSDPVNISERAWRMEGSRMFAKVGSKVNVEELLRGVIVQSGNDATVALAEHIAGTEEAFAELMNQYAQRLDMRDSRFMNSTGMPNANHYTTARDMALLGRALIRDFPDSYRWYSVKEYTYNGIKQYNRNSLLWNDSGVDGIKTGHTESAGYCLVASADKGGMRLISAVLGTKSEKARSEESQALLAYGFRSFETHRLYTSQQPLAEAVVWKGDKNSLSLGLLNDLWITIPRGQYKNLNAAIDMTPRIIAPAEKGQQLGTVRIKLGEETWSEQNLISLEAVEKGSLVKNIIDGIKLYFE